MTAVEVPVTSATRRVLACSSAGGHFKQLVSLVVRIPDVAEVTWLTYDHRSTRDLLTAVGRAGDRVVHAPYAAPRDVLNLWRDSQVAYNVLRSGRYDLAVSTGAGIAVSTLPMAAAMGVRSCYIESATRADGPSVSARILARTPGIELYTQNVGYGRRWRYAGSVHDGFERGPDRQEDVRLSRAVVVLGTIRPYGFRRLVQRLLEVLPTGTEVLWQTGCTDVSGLPLEGHEFVPGPELEHAMREADVIVAHAGTGTALTAFELGRCPVLVPRRASHGEHVDDHQLVTARALAERGLAVHAEVGELDQGVLERAAARTVRRRSEPPPLTL